MRVRTLLNPFKCYQRYSKQNWAALFPDFNGTLDVEIGFGNGQFLSFYALNQPTRPIVGFEIRHKLVEMVQQRLEEQRLINAQAIRAHGQFALEDMFENESIDKIFIFHPDPWPKFNHRNRRLINSDFLKLVHQKLKPNGCMYLATDVSMLWNYMLEVIKNSAYFYEKNNDVFWDICYQTRWKEMSLGQNRSLFYATFKKSPTLLQ